MSSASIETRRELDSFLKCGDHRSAFACAQRLWQQSRTASTAGRIVSVCRSIRQQLPQELAHVVSHRTTILRSCTVEPVVDLLKADALLHGIDLNVSIGGFNTYSQEILTSNSDLYTGAPQSVILFVHLSDLVPGLWNTFARTPYSQVRDQVTQACRSYADLIAVFRRSSDAPLLLHGFDLPAHLDHGVLDGHIEQSQSGLVQELNSELRKLCAEFPMVYMVDYGTITAQHGRLDWYDHDRWITTGLPFSSSSIATLAREWLKFLCPISGRIAKALVTDLDNTLWGGVIGEDGADGIALGDDYPGAKYKGIQRVLLDLKRRGVVLAINSKNNLEDVQQVLESHPHMLLRPNDFSLIKANWNDKAHNMVEIARELNLGLDSMVFLDDNPGECTRVQSALPQVHVLAPFTDPRAAVDQIRNCPLLERVSISEEDLQRSRYYVEERARDNLKQSLPALEDFYCALKVSVHMFEADSTNLPRAAQLTQRTNQFNTTTRRYSEQQLLDLLTSDDWKVLLIEASDRFGDNGIVGLALLEFDKEHVRIDSLLMSCRVIGRTIETAFLSGIVALSKNGACRTLSAEYRPTAKNQPVKNLYRDHGFDLECQREGDVSIWTLDLTVKGIECPAWICFENEAQ